MAGNEQRQYTWQNLLGTPVGLGLCLMIAAAGAYFLWNHTGHVLTAVPYLFLLLCPLMHIFGHGSHRHGARTDGKPNNE